MIKIEKNIPIPLRGAISRKYPFSQMGIGDSFLWPIKYSRKEMSKASNAARNFKNKSKDCKNFKFIVRKMGNGIRVWRIE